MPGASLDSWVLLSVLLCGTKGGTLRDIIACGDYANHAVFPFKRLRDGLFALQRAGLVLLSERRYRAAPFAKRAWTAIQRKERRLAKQWDSLDAWLSKRGPAPRVAEHRRISNENYDAAVKEYLDNF